jgi:hypothetical protein
MGRTFFLLFFSRNSRSKNQSFCPGTQCLCLCMCVGVCVYVSMCLCVCASPKIIGFIRYVSVYLSVYVCVCVYKGPLYPAITKYIRSCSRLCPWHWWMDNLPEFAPEYTGSYLITLQKPSVSIRGITPVDIWRRATGNDIVRVTQEIVSKTCNDTYPNFSQLTLSKDGDSHCLYFLYTVYYDPSFTSAEDAEDPIVIMKFATKNTFGSLDARLVLDVVSDKVSCDYEIIFCLLWINKSRLKEKTYIWVSVWWKTKN